MAGAAVLAVTGCDRPADSAYSSLPLFSAADEAGAPQLHDGIWLEPFTQEKPCPLDFKRPVGEWPDCANWLVVKGPQMSNLVLSFAGDTGKPSWGWRGETYLLAGGTPPIFQRQWRAGTFWYRAAAGVSLGDQGAIVRYGEVPIPCAPLDVTPPDPSVSPEKPNPDKPVDDDCKFADRGTLQLRAKKASDGAGAADHVWIRDITPSDYQSIKTKPLPAPPPQDAKPPAPEDPAKPASKPSA